MPSGDTRRIRMLAESIRIQPGSLLRNKSIIEREDIDMYKNRIIRDEQNRPCISSRTLYELFNPDKSYDAWFRDMCSFGLKEGADYSTVSHTVAGSNAPCNASLRDHLLVLPAASELFLLQANPASRKKRQDLLQLSLYWDDPESLVTRLAELLQVPETAEAFVNRMAEKNRNDPPAPAKRTYADLVAAENEVFPISTIALDYGMSGMKLNEILESLGVQHRVQGAWRLSPEYRDRGYVIEEAHGKHNWDGASHDTYRLKWTPFGRLFIYTLLQKIGIKPLMEMKKHE